MRTSMLILFILLLISGGGSARADEPLRLMANFWEPFTGNDLFNDGIASDIVTSVLERAGYGSMIEVRPWTRAFRNTRLGQADGIVAIWHTPERAEDILMSDAYYTNRIALLKHRQNAFELEDMSSLDGLKVGVGRGYDYTPEFKAAQNFFKEEAANLKQNLTKLARKRIDLVISDDLIAEYYIAQGFLPSQEASKITFVSKPLFEIPLYFGMSKKHPDHVAIIEAFNKHLADFIKDGSHERLLRRHGVHYGIATSGIR